MGILSEIELERYRRQLMLHGFGMAEQERLKESTALVSGIGGLGGTAAIYLAVAGIGRLILVHSGTLTLSNMNRQILMTHDWIGRPRVIRAKETLERLNPDVEIEVHDLRLNNENIMYLLNGVDIALSARPNFEERRVLNRACIRKAIPMVEAAMNGMEGYIFNIIPGKGPCLDCLFPDDNPEWEELGFPVLGAVSGTLGCIMATEAIKLLTGYGKPLFREMLLYNLHDLDFRKVRIRKDPSCRTCNEEDKPRKIQAPARAEPARQEMA
ncbi:MAG TPA: HesA/MoeB/ThiF family protein [Nitrospirae bacterium]|nr:HesA/MoeB/ThiF family protein [Nitrospirota bacterium]